jgi:2-haloacid dehalogenase
MILLFDINETVLDLEPVARRVRSVLGSHDAAELWFTTLLHHSVAMSLAGQFTPMSAIGAAVLKMLADGRRIALSDDQAHAVVAGMTALPAHPDVEPTLARLSGAGVRLAALSNSSTAALRTQLRHAGLDPYFEKQLSVEQVGKYKPHPDVYLRAAAAMGVPPGECMMVAAHGWDVAGAAWAGMNSAFVARGTHRPFPLGPTPTHVVHDLVQLADLLLAP